MALLGNNRTVLLVADEALHIYSHTPRATRLVEIVPWEADNFVSNIANIVTRECGGKPILILNDMVEQHYRKERVIKTGVGVMDRANMLKRKIAIAFPSYPVRAALPLREKLDKKEGKLAADIYIFAAVPDTKQFQQVMGAANAATASISGFCLLPVESSDMVRALGAALTEKGRAPSKWTLFIGQHKNGGLRQIVTKNGELALTRMTSIIDSDRDATTWATDVMQEFRATMTYLTRFGFQKEDGLDIILISNPTAGDVFGRMLEGDFNYRSLTVFEAANFLRLSLGPQEESHYADILHVVWAGRKNKFILPMKASELDRVVRPRQAALAASLLLFGGAAFLAYQTIGVLQESATASSDLDLSMSRIQQLEVQYQNEVKRKEELGFPVLLVQSSIAVHAALEQKSIKPLRLFDGVGRALGQDLRIDKISVGQASSTAAPTILDGFVALNPDTPPPPLFKALMQMTYPSTTDIEKGNKEVAGLRARLERALPGHTVAVTKFLKDYEYSEELVVETGQTGKENQPKQQDFLAEITVTGPASND